MSVSHNAVRETTRASAMDRLLAYIEARRRATEMIEDWEAYEEDLHRLFMDAECEMMAEELTRLDVEVIRSVLAAMTKSFTCSPHPAVLYQYRGMMSFVLRDFTDLLRQFEGFYKFLQVKLCLNRRIPLSSLR